jgi:hypothetical protein
MYIQFNTSTERLMHVYTSDDGTKWMCVPLDANGEEDWSKSYEVEDRSLIPSNAYFHGE